MTRLPIVDFKTMEKVLRGLGFQPIRNLVSEILREIEITPEQFQQALKKI